MFWLNDSSLVNAVAKIRCALGARSWTISIIAVPSSPSPSWPGSTSVSAGRSPDAIEAASESTPSDSTPTVTPVPVTLNRARAASAPCALSPSLTVEP